MLAILIVDDRPYTLKQLRDYLAHEFPYAVIHTAATVKDALALIEEAERKGIRYKITILDFRLPRDFGESPEIDTTLRRRLRESTSREAVVFHVTAYPDSPEIARYLLEEQALYPSSGRSTLISKLSDESWTEKLYEAIRKVIHNDRITERLDRLFGTGSQQLPAGPLSPRAGAAEPNTTQELAALTDDIEAHWRYLADSTRKRIERLFRVQSAPDGETVRLSLF